MGACVALLQVQLTTPMYICCVAPSHVQQVALSWKGTSTTGGAPSDTDTHQRSLTLAAAGVSIHATELQQAPLPSLAAPARCPCWLRVDDEVVRGPGGLHTGALWCVQVVRDPGGLQQRLASQLGAAAHERVVAMFVLCVARLYRVPPQHSCPFPLVAGTPSSALVAVGSVSACEPGWWLCRRLWAVASSRCPRSTSCCRTARRCRRPSSAWPHRARWCRCLPPHQQRASLGWCEHGCPVCRRRCWRRCRRWWASSRPCSAHHRTPLTRAPPYSCATPKLAPVPLHPLMRVSGDAQDLRPARGLLGRPVRAGAALPPCACTLVIDMPRHCPELV